MITAHAVWNYRAFVRDLCAQFVRTRRAGQHTNRDNRRSY